MCIARYFLQAHLMSTGLVSCQYLSKSVAGCWAVCRVPLREDPQNMFMPPLPYHASTVTLTDYLTGALTGRHRWRISPSRHIIQSARD